MKLFFSTKTILISGSLFVGLSANAALKVIGGGQKLSEPKVKIICTDLNGKEKKIVTADYVSTNNRSLSALNKVDKAKGADEIVLEVLLVDYDCIIKSK